MSNATEQIHCCPNCGPLYYVKVGRCPVCFGLVTTSVSRNDRAWRNIVHELSCEGWIEQVRAATVRA